MINLYIRYLHIIVINIYILFVDKLYYLFNILFGIIIIIKFSKHYMLLNYTYIYDLV